MEYAKPDAIIISETHPHNDVQNYEFMPQGYSTPLRKDRDKWGGGVLITVKDCCTITALNLPENDAEIVLGEVLLRDHDGTILVDSNIVSAYSKKKPRKTFVFAKANWSKMKEDASTFVSSF